MELYLCLQIKWLRFLRNMSDTIMPNSSVVVCNTKYLSDVSQLLQDTDEMYIACHTKFE